MGVEDTKRYGKWSGRRDSNARPSAWKADALPLSYARPCMRPRLFKQRRARPVNIAEL